MKTTKSSKTRSFLTIAIGGLIFILGCETVEPFDLVPPTVMDDLTLPRLEINETTLHLQTYGNPSNPPIFFLHGGPGVDAKELLTFTQPHNGYNLTNDYFLIIWDQRGTGLSQRHDDPDVLTVDQYQKDLEAIINTYVEPEKQIVFFAHSFGGLLAANYMNTYPEKIAGAVLMEPAAFSSELQKEVKATGSDFGAEWLNDLVWSRQFVAMNDHERADCNISIGYTGLKDSERDSDPYPMNRMGAHAMYNVLKSVTQTEVDYTTNLNTITPEILFIVGENTESMDQEFQEKQRQVFQNSRVEVIPNAGHDDIVWSKANQSMVFIKDYLSTLSW